MPRWLSSAVGGSARALCSHWCHSAGSWVGSMSPLYLTKRLSISSPSAFFSSFLQRKLVGEWAACGGDSAASCCQGTSNPLWLYAHRWAWRDDTIPCRTQSVRPDLMKTLPNSSTPQRSRFNSAQLSRAARRLSAPPPPAAAIPRLPPAVCCPQPVPYLTAGSNPVAHGGWGGGVPTTWTRSEMASSGFCWRL